MSHLVVETSPRVLFQSQAPKAQEKQASGFKGLLSRLFDKKEKSATNGSMPAGKVTAQPQAPKLDLFGEILIKALQEEPAIQAPKEEAFVVLTKPDKRFPNALPFMKHDTSLPHGLATLQLAHAEASDSDSDDEDEAAAGLANEASETTGYGITDLGRIFSIEPPVENLSQDDSGNPFVETEAEKMDSQLKELLKAQEDHGKMLLDIQGANGDTPTRLMLPMRRLPEWANFDQFE